MTNLWLKSKNWFLLLGDVAALYAGLWATLIIRYQENFNSQIPAHLAPFSLIFFVWIIIFYISGLYDLRRAKNKVQFFLFLLTVFSFCALLAMGFFYLMPQIGISPKTNLFLDLSLTVVLLFFWRLLFNRLIGRPQKKVLLVGENKQSIALATAINLHPQWGYQVAAIISEDKFTDYQSRLTELNITTVAVSDDLYQTQGLTDSLYETLSERVEIFTLTKFYEFLLKKIPLSIISKIWFLDNLTERDKQIFDKIKRLFDISLSLLALALTLPLYPFLYLLIKLDSKGPFFYTQTRTGRLGKKFIIVKLRSMKKDAEKNGAEWATPQDRRVTSVGRFLRKIRLDEIPQLLNVLGGEMSFVGPRPERPEFIEQLEKDIPFYKQRLLVKPGITGWAQVNYKYSSDTKGALEKLQYDLYYIKNRSLWLDISILLKTISIVLKGGGH